MNVNQIYPALDFHVALFLTSLIQNETSVSVIEGVFYSIKWAHDISGVTNPCDSKIVHSLLESARNICGGPVQKKKPLTSDIIFKMFNTYPPASISLYHLRSLVFIVLGFAGFLRVSELIHLKCSDISFKDDYVELIIRSSKIDQTNKGETVLIAQTNNSTCPYNMLRLYFEKCNFVPSEDNYIFRQLSFCYKQKVHRLRKSGCLSCTRCREIVREMLTDIGLNADEYGTHSLRRGGATVSAMNNTADRLFKKHGRWKSEKANDGYVTVSISERLTVSANLGL